MKIFRMVAAFLIAMGVLSGCGGGGSSTTGDTGSLVVGLTDAQGDFLSYAVDVKSIKLTHADGRVVEALPQATRVDFAQYVDLTEFVTAATVPNGRYTKASLLLDYTNADIQVEVGGVPVQAQVQDSSGNPITTREVDVTLDDGHPLVVAPGVSKNLTLDFDLQTSHTVDTSVTPPVVTAEPLLVADVEMKAPKSHRLRGLLQSVDESQNLIQLKLRPFEDHDGDFGSFNAYVDDNTSYEIDGVSYQGGAGLAQLALLPLSSWVVLTGEINTTTQKFVASEVYAGSSVPGSTQDAVTGVVTARSGDQLTVRARAIALTNGSLIFNKDVTVTLDPVNTVVTRQRSQLSTATGDISVGQRLELLGTITDTGGVLTMDVTTKARMLLTFLSGNAVSVNGSELTLNLQHIEGLAPATYNFAGTGVSGADDADPTNYQINTGTLNLTGIQIGDPVRVRGFVTPFGTAPADFTADTIVGLANVPAMMVVQWPIAKAAPFVSSSDSGVVVDVTGSILHRVQRYGVMTDLSGQTPTLQPESGGSGLFAIQGGGAIQLYTTFSAFDTALNSRLAAGGKMKRLTALGRYDDTTTTMTARAVSVVMKN